MLIAWGSNLFGLGLGGLSVKGVGDAFANFGFSVPIPAVDHVFSGFEFLGVILVTAIPFGIYDLVEAMDNVESAEAAGDDYPTTRVLTADGVVSLIGCLMGNPFINAVYIGHPGWKAMGGRIGYSAATGIMVIVLSWFGIISVLLALVPVVAISPILLYIGMLIGAQAFQTTPLKHAPAIVLALTPHLAAWAKLQIDTMLGSTLNAAQSVGGLAADKAGEVKAAAIASLPQQRRALSRARSDGRRLDPRRPRARRDRRVRDRARVRQGLGLRAGRRGADLFRLHARRSGRHRRRPRRDACRWRWPMRSWRPDSLRSASTARASTTSRIRRCRPRRRSSALHGFVGTASRRKLITLPSAAKPAPSASATVAPSRPARPKHSAASGRAGGLPDQPRGRDHAAGAAAAMRRRAGHDRLHVRRLEEAEPEAAEHHAPDDVWHARVRRKHRQQRHADAEHHKPDAAEDAGGVAIGQAAADRRHDRRPPAAMAS